MKKVLLSVVLAAIYAFAGCQKIIVPPKSDSSPSTGSSLGLIAAGDNYSPFGDSIYFKKDNEYRVFVPKRNGTLFYYKHYKKNQESYECSLRNMECVSKDENGIVYDRQKYRNHRHDEPNELEMKLQELYKKAKASCKE